MKMSTIDIRLPKYYKGFDIDVLLQKLSNDEELANEEELILLEAQHIYYKKFSDENKQKWDDWRKAHPGQYFTHIDPQRADKN